MIKTKLKQGNLKNNKFSGLKKTGLRKISKIKSSKQKLKLESNLFVTVYNNHKGICILTGRPVIKDRPENYPHYLSKHAYPDLRLLENNVGLVCNSEYHDMIDIIIHRLQKELGYGILEQKISRGENIEKDIKRIYIEIKKEKE